MSCSPVAVRWVMTSHSSDTDVGDTELGWWVFEFLLSPPPLRVGMRSNAVIQRSRSVCILVLLVLCIDSSGSGSGSSVP